MQKINRFWKMDFWLFLCTDSICWKGRINSLTNCGIRALPRQMKGRLQSFMWKIRGFEALDSQSTNRSYWICQEPRDGVLGLLQLHYPINLFIFQKIIYLINLRIGNLFQNHVPRLNMFNSHSVRDHSTILW